MGHPQPFRNLLAPGRIGALELRNRIVMSPMGSNLAERDGYLGERIKRYYEARAGRSGADHRRRRGGRVSSRRLQSQQVAVSDDVSLPGLTDLAVEIHLLGDCQGIGYIEGAMIDAGRIARTI